MRMPLLRNLAVALRGACCIAALHLAACSPSVAPPARASQALLGGDIVAAAPRGYCIDLAATRQTKDTAVVLMGRCPNMQTVVPAVVTMSVGPVASAGVLAAGGPALTAYFVSPQGRAALSRTGKPVDVTVLGALMARDAYLLHVKDRAAGEYWRAVIGLRGRLVTVSATGVQNAPLALPDGRALVEATVATLRRANGPE